MNKGLNELIIKEVKNIDTYVRETRGYFHQYPELSGQECKTSEFAKLEIKKMGIKIQEVSKNGFIGIMECKKPGKTIVLRADMDALPMEESCNNLVGLKKYISKTNGICHSCGHDSHMAILLGAVKVIHNLKEFIQGTILFCFEEGEEQGIGIKGMIKALSKKSVDGAWGIHVVPSLKSGEINIEGGNRMAGDVDVNIRVIGKGGHASRPDLCVNPIFGAANILMSLTSAWINTFSPNETVTLGISTINGGTTSNVIPEFVDITGSLRFFNENEGKKAISLVKKVSSAVAEAQGCKVEFNDMINNIGKPTINDINMARIAKQALNEVLPEGSIVKMNKSFASESFSHYSEICPSIMAFLGITNDKIGSGADLHNIKFDIDEDALKYGVISTVKFTIDFLNPNN